MQKKTSFTEQAAGSWGDIAVHFGYNESFVIKPTIWVTIMISQWTYLRHPMKYCLDMYPVSPILHNKPGRFKAHDF